MVEGVPKEMRSTSKLFTYFNTLYPGEVWGFMKDDGGTKTGEVRKYGGVVSVCGMNSLVDSRLPFSL